MTSEVLYIHRKHPLAKLPKKGSSGAAGWDLYSVEKDTKIQPGGKALISTGLSIGLPEGTYGRIAPRSGLAWKKQVVIGAGVIDRDYTGIVKVVVFNFGAELLIIKPGDRIAQLIVERICDVVIEEKGSLAHTERGEGGFGSTDE